MKSMFKAMKLLFKMTKLMLTRPNRCSGQECETLKLMFLRMKSVFILNDIGA